MKLSLLYLIFIAQTSPLVYTPQRLKPILTYELLSGWTGYREYLKVYPEGRGIFLLSNPLLSIREIRVGEIPLDTLKPLLLDIDRVRPESLKLEYKGPAIFDAPIERITLKGKNIILSPTAQLPEDLSDIKREIFRLKGFLKTLPSFPILSVDSVFIAKDSLKGEEISIEGILLKGEKGMKIVKELSSPEKGIELKYEPPPDFLESHKKVLLIGRLTDKGLLRVDWIENE